MYSRLLVPILLAAALATVGCGGGSSGGTPGDRTANPLVLLDMSVAGYDGVPLNSIIEFEFSEVLDPDTVRSDTIWIRQGPNYGKQVAGHFEVDGRFVKFYPRLPVTADLSDSGLQPGLPYRATIPGIPTVATVRSFAGERIRKTTELNFQTALTGSPGMFVDNFEDPVPPMVKLVNPADGAMDVPADSEIILTFNLRPLNPATVTSSNITLQMVERGGVPFDPPRIIPGKPVLEQTFESVSVTFAPTFPLADDALYRLRVDRRVQDLVGNDVMPFESTFSLRNEPLRHTSISLTFNQKEYVEFADETNTTASWNEAVADALAALFTAAGGNGTAGDLVPNANRNITPDDYPRGVEVQVDEDTGIEFDVYNFRSIDIPSGVTVRFNQRSGGPNRPVALLSLKNIHIAGTLTVSGGIGDDGEGTNYTTSYIPPARGGKAGPGGGNGSDNDQGTVTKNPPRMDGEDVYYGGGGGDGGGAGTYSYYGSTTYYYSRSYTAGGGGGGGSRTAGQKGKDGTYPTSGYYGLGGKGGLSTTQRGFPLNYERDPNVGGAGGGAGGKGWYQYYTTTSQTNYFGGAGAGGGGGGAFTIQSAGDVTIDGTAQLLADGGDGGQAMKFYVYSGGAGGAGAGGSVKVVATGQVHFGQGATMSVRGGQGGIYTGTYTYYHAGLGGAGGDGYIRVEAVEDENSPGKPVIDGLNQTNVTYSPVSTGVFAPRGGGAPSVGQTVWMNLGVFGPIMEKPVAEDVDATLYNDSMTIEVQMAQEDQNAIGYPDLEFLDITDQDQDGQYDDTLNPKYVSEWVKFSEIEKLNGNNFQFIRVRISFQLDPNQVVSEPLPFLNFLRIPYAF